MVILVKKEFYSYSAEDKAYRLDECTFRFFSSINSFNNFKQTREKEFLDFVSKKGSSVVELVDENNRIKMRWSNSIEEFSIVGEFDSEQDGMIYLNSTNESGHLNPASFMNDFS